MLKSLDLILDLTVVMLVASMAVSVLTQIYTGLRNTRGAHLRSGLVDLLKQIDPSVTAAIADEVAGAILAHPLIHDSDKRLGTLVHRDEFTRLLMEIAAGRGAQAVKEETRSVLIRALEANGIADPEASLKAIRAAALELEASHPQLAAHARREMAILRAAKSELVAKINGCFDQTIDRVIARFTLSTRQVSLIAAFVVAMALQLDSVALIKRLINGDTAPSSRARRVGSVSRSLRFLLSLGAPFWIEALNDLQRLPSVLARKDDLQRTQRATADKHSER